MFYLKLAYQNVRKSLSNFLPFLLATSVMFAMTLILANIGFSDSISHLKGAEAARLMMMIGLVVIILFSVIIVSYSYRFLLKQRTKEFGLYNILGLNKRNIASISFWELCLTFIVTLVIGSITGLVLSEFLYLVFVHLIGGDYFNLTVSFKALSLTIMVFAAIFALLMCFALFTIRRNSAINLLKDNTRGEREPRGRLMLSLISLAMLGTAYYMALSVQGPLEALMKFAIAVILVILGTYLLYIGVTIFILKRQKANKNYYYKPEHFITTSSMLYRMKTNAVGLANITILVTMTFVTLATSVALYVGVQKVVKDQFPKNTTLTVSSQVINDNKAQLASYLKENSIDASQADQYSSFFVMSPYDVTSAHQVTVPAKNTKITQVAAIEFATREDLLKFGNDLPEIKENQVLLYQKMGKQSVQTLNWYGESLQVSKEVSNIKGYSGVPAVVDVLVFIVKDDNALMHLNTVYNEALKKSNPESNFSHDITTETHINLPIKKQDSLFKAFQTARDKGSQEKLVVISTEKDSMETIMSFTGGFLFIGFMLGLTFILGAALIIYYKQISEGAEDKRSYRILQEVGLTKKEVKKSINSQVLIVFFMPIIVSIVHFAAAFVMISKLISLFGITDIGMIAGVSGITILLITILYFFIYRKTSKIYYRIVER